MVITHLEELDKGKFKVYIDHEYHFCLYKKDINLYQLTEDMEMTDGIYTDIYNMVLKRAKQKAMAILKHMDRTESELEFKLKQAGYSESIISDTMAYIKSFHYIDDSRYALNYIHFKKDTKSKRKIIAELSQKGIDSSLIEEAFIEEYESEDLAIQKAISKKTKDVSTLSEEEKAKLAASLYRKGFQLDFIKKYIN